MTLSERMKKNRGWCVAYFGTTAAFAVCLMMIYFTILSNYIKGEAKKVSAQKKVDDLGLDFWSYVVKNSETLSRVEEESDPVFIAAENLLHKCSDKVQILLGESRDGKRELLLYTDYCYGWNDGFKSMQDNPPCSRVLKLIDQAPEIKSFNIGIAEHAPNLAEGGVNYVHQFTVDNSTVKFKVADNPPKLTLFHTGLATEKIWSDAAKSSRDTPPSKRFLYTQLGERVFRKIQPFDIKSGLDPESKSSTPCTPGNSFRSAVTSAFKISNYQKVSNQRHAYYRKDPKDHISQLSWGQHLQSKNNHFRKIDE